MRHRAGLGAAFPGAQIAQAAGIEMLHVPYKGAPDIMNDLYGGRVASFVTALSTLRRNKDGRMRVLVTTGEKRSAQLPDVQTAREAGFPQLTMMEWFGLLAPARINSADKVIALHAAVQKATGSTSVQKLFATLVMEPQAMAPAEFATRIQADIARWGQTAKSLNYEAIDG